jgi:uncharacterized repeat protein (TIGR02543 family)
LHSHHHIGRKDLETQANMKSKSIASAIACWLLFSTALLLADVNVLIIGNTQPYHDYSYTNQTTPAFDPTAVRSELEKILTGAGLGAVNVTLESRDSGSSVAFSSLAQWYHYPYPAGVETTTRWPNLRGELTRAWDYVVLIGDPYAIEKMPGLYAHGVAMVAQEVARGSAETVLLMPWPASTSTSTLNHYKEVVYRTGRTGGYKVAPAGLAWQAAGSPVGAYHPTASGAYIAAASIYSRIWGNSASTSTYTYNDAMADTVHATVTSNVGKTQYTGDFNFQSPFLTLGDKRREVHFSHKGTSTERGFAAAAQEAMTRCNVRWVYELVYLAGNGTALYNSNTPYDDGMGWPLASRSMPIAWNHGRSNSTGQDYVANPDFWQLGMGYRYQTASFEPDVHLGQIRYEDLDLATKMASLDTPAGKSQRCLPWRMLFAQIHREFPTQSPIRDANGHLAYPIERDAVGSYMYTLYSGRCPVDPKPDPMTVEWFARKVGYETAWRMGRCVSRAPGFKVMPASSAATEADVTPSTSRALSVYFINPPNSDVTVAIKVDDPYAGDVSTTLLTFTPQNYDQPQTVSVIGRTGKAGAFPFNVILTTASTDAAYDGVSDSWNFVNTRPLGPVQGDLTLSGNGVTIWPAHTTPLVADGTDFGLVSGSVTRTFTITNSSTANTVNLIKIPRVTVTDPQGYFTLNQDADTGTLAPGASTTFQITCNPPPGVSHTATVTVESTNPTNPAYSFKVSCSRVGVPTVVNRPASPSTTTSARLAGALGAGTIQASVSLCWGLQDGGTSSTANWQNTVALGTVSEGADFVKLLTGLVANQTYVYRFYVTNAAGSGWSPQAAFFHPEPSNNCPAVAVNSVTFNSSALGVDAGLSTNVKRSSIIHDWDNVLDAFGGGSHASYDATAFMFGNNRVPDDGDSVMGNWLKTPDPSGAFLWKTESLDWITWDTTQAVTLAGYQIDLSLSDTRPTKFIRFSVGGVVVDTYDNGSAVANGLVTRYFNQPVSGSSFKVEVTSATVNGPLIREIDAVLLTGTVMVANKAPTNITETTATVNSKLWSQQNNSTVTLRWGTSDGGTNPAAWQSSVVVGTWNTATTDLSRSLTGLQPGVRYYYTFSVSNGTTTVWAAPTWQFTTKGGTPSSTHTLAYHGNGSEGGMAPVDGNSPYSNNSVVTVFGNTGSLTRSGYTFNGWNTQTNGGGVAYNSGNTFTITSSTNLYAQWAPVSYVVSYNANGASGGSAPANQSKLHNLSLTLSGQGSLVKSGFIFSGWNTAANGSGITYAAGAAYTTNAAVTLYAQWASGSYMVSYNENGATGGSAPSNQTKTYNVSLTLSNQGSLVKSGYVFTGWNTAANGSGITYAAGAGYTTNAAVTLYAQWVPDSYVVSYDGNGATGGSAPANQTKTYNVSLTLSTQELLVKTGYVFIGWNTAANGSGTAYAAGVGYTANANATLYAQWNSIPLVDAGPDQTAYIGADRPWTPADITMAAWYDAADASTITQSGGLVSQWRDKSGNNRHIDQATGSRQPVYASSGVNGRGTITFDGSDDTLSRTPVVSTKTTSTSVFVVSRPSSASVKGATLKNGDSYGGGIGYGTGTFETLGNRFIYLRETYQWHDSGINYGTGANIVSSITSTSSIKNYLNSTLIQTVNALVGTPSGTTSVGGYGSRCFSGAVVEVIMIDSELSTSDREKVEGYLAHKWGLASSLAAGHPYLSAPPNSTSPGATINLNGTVTDADQTPTGAWSVVSKPASSDVVFGNPSAIDTTATFTVAGTYVLRLTGSDSHVQTSDDVTITIDPPLPTHYATWAAGGFAHAFTDIGLNADPDGDRMSNLMEFALGLDPTLPSGGEIALDGTVHGQPRSVQTDGNFEFYFMRRVDHYVTGSVDCTAQFSGDLDVFYNNVVTPTRVAVSSSNPDYEVVKVAFPASLPDGKIARFARVKMEVVP